MFRYLIKPVYAEVNIGQYFGPARSFPTVADLVNVLLRNVFTVTGIIALAAIVIAGLNIIGHGMSGKAEGIEKNKNALTAAIVGLVLIIGAYFIIEILETLTGYKFLNPVNIQ